MNNNYEKFYSKIFRQKQRIFEGGKRFNSNNKKNDDTLISIITVIKNKSEYIRNYR